MYIIKKHTKKLEDTTCTFLLLSVAISHLHVYGDLYIGSSENGSSHVCDKAEIFYVSIIIMLR